jgi:uncharacterized protein YndB with AHSA1/START domain
MASSKFVYVTFIRTTPEELWSAILNPDFMRKYWFNIHFDTDWKLGSSWKMMFPDGRVADTGEIVEVEPAKRLVLKWRNEFRPELKAEGYSQCVFQIEPVGNATKLSITHTIDVENAKFIDAVSGGWPRILSNLKSLLETGEVMEI